MFPGQLRNPLLVAAGLPTLTAAMEQAEITTPRRIAAFLATLLHESWLEYNIKQIGATGAYAGRGYIQLTGSYNYDAAGRWLGIDLLVDPDLALSLKWSAQIARWYWTVARRINPLADSLQMGKVCAAIGYPLGDGSEDLERTESFKAALRYLTGSVPAGITTNRK